MAEQESSSKDSKTVEVALAPKAIKRKNTSPPELQTPSKRTTEQASSQGERIEDVFQDEILKAFADITSFKQFARSNSQLCLDQSYIKTIVEDHKSNVEEQKLELLFKWREIEGNEASVLRIRSLLQSYRERDIQEVAREVTVNTAVPNNQTTRVADSNSDSVDVRLSGGIPSEWLRDQEFDVEEYDDYGYNRDEKSNSDYSEEGIPSEWLGDQDKEYDIEEYNSEEEDDGY